MLHLVSLRMKKIFIYISKAHHKILSFLLGLSSSMINVEVHYSARIKCRVVKVQTVLPVIQTEGL